MSQQNAGTPRDFLRAVEKKFKVKFVWDFACTTQDCVVKEDKQGIIIPHGYCIDQGSTDSLKEDWNHIHGGLLGNNVEEAGWLNHPFKKTTQFVAKAHRHSQGEHSDDPLDGSAVFSPASIRIFQLCPANVGSLWFGEYVHGQADVYFLFPRITFIDPETGVPFIHKVTGKPQTGLNDCLLIDWAGAGDTYWWHWRKTLDQDKITG